MEQTSDKIKRILIIFIVGVVIYKNASLTGLFEARNHKGKGYYVKVPTDWKKVKKKKGMVYPEGVAVVMFVPKEIDLDLQAPETYISIFTKKLASAIWIEDEMPDILMSIRRAGNKIMDKGQIKIDGLISEWIVYHDSKVPAFILEFYMVTDSNLFYKIQYAAPPGEFNTSRRSFEELKSSFRFRFSMY